MDNNTLILIIILVIIIILVCLCYTNMERFTDEAIYYAEQEEENSFIQFRNYIMPYLVKNNNYQQQILTADIANYILAQYKIYLNIRQSLPFTFTLDSNDGITYTQAVNNFLSSISTYRGNDKLGDLDVTLINALDLENYNNQVSDQENYVTIAKNVIIDKTYNDLFDSYNLGQLPTNISNMLNFSDPNSVKAMIAQALD